MDWRTRNHRSQAVGKIQRKGGLTHAFVRMNPCRREDLGFQKGEGAGGGIGSDKCEFS